MSESGKIRALALLSGGLDSQLAVCVLKEQGIAVTGIVFESPFFGSERGRQAAAQIGIEPLVVDFTADIVALLEHPPHGFGNAMNPCIDCHAKMLNRAGKLMTELGYDFLCTGEVLNERPMSQNRQSLEVVARDSGYPDLILRPLSARLLPETRPEKEGWVDRSRLLALSGRGRKPQFALAEKYGILSYPTPAGGCLLTEEGFARRLQDLKEHEGFQDRQVLSLLKVGRHFRLSKQTRVVVGRNQNENEIIEAPANRNYIILQTAGVPGPTCLLSPLATAEEMRTAAALCARYSDAPAGRPVRVEVTAKGACSDVEVMPMLPRDAELLLIGRTAAMSVGR